MEKMVEVERATQDELRQDLKSLFQGAIRVTLEMVLEEELKAMVGARRFERVGSRKDHRNGTYLRRLLTSLGQIDVMVPRSREGGSPADVMGRYRRRSEEVDEMMVEAYVSGVSQRKMGDVTEALLGERVGRSTVSRVAKRLDGAVEALRSAPIEGPHPYLYLDATFLDARWARKIENVSALVAYAVDSDGHRRLLAITLPSLPTYVRHGARKEIRVGRRQRKRTCWDCEREWKRMVVPLEPGRPSEARQLLRTRR